VIIYLLRQKHGLMCNNSSSSSSSSSSDGQHLLTVVIGLSSNSSNSSSSSTESCTDVAHVVAATVAADISDMCVIDDDDVGSDVSADVCRDVGVCVTEIELLQLISTKQSFTVAVAASVLSDAGSATARRLKADAAGSSDSDSDCGPAALRHTLTLLV
jgi:hypothetical protein